MRRCGPGVSQVVPVFGWSRITGAPARQRLLLRRQCIGRRFLFVLLLHSVRKGNNQAAASGADGVALGTGATVHVHLFVRQVQRLHGQHSHHRKGFIDFEQIDRIGAPACFL